MTPLPSDAEIGLEAQVTQQDLREIGIAPRREDREAVPGDPQHKPGDPLLQPEADGSGELATAWAAWILAEPNSEEEQGHLDKLLHFQYDDFYGIFKALNILYSGKLAEAWVRNPEEEERRAELRRQATDDLFWDRILEISEAGEEDVYDLTVPGPASWLARPGVWQEGWWGGR